jgi:tetratricopeptide (TPR) repeat protein
LSRTTVVSRNAQWWRRFFLILGAALLAAIVFNIYVTRRLDAEAAFANAKAQMASGSGLAPAGQARLPQASPMRVFDSAPTVTPGRSGNEPIGARPSQAAEPPTPMPPPARPSRQATVPVVAAPGSAAGSAARELPTDRTRSRASGEGKKALYEARTAFEHDDFARAIQMGRAALAAGEGGAHTILGAAYFKVGRYEDAVREYSEALRLEPGNPALAKRVEIARRAALAPQ